MEERVPLPLPHPQAYLGALQGQAHLPLPALLTRPPPALMARILPAALLPRALAEDQAPARTSALPM